MQIKRAFRYRFYPTSEQETILARTFGCARFAYNHMLRLRTDAWYERQERVGYLQTSSELTRLKRNPEFAWLSEVSSVPVQQALRHLQTAFTNFFAKRAAYPAFHSKHGAQSATYVATGFNFNPEKQQLTLAKMLDRWISAGAGLSQRLPRSQRSQFPEILPVGISPRCSVMMKWRLCHRQKARSESTWV